MLFDTPSCCFDASAQTEKIKLPPRTVEGKLSNGLRYLILPNGQPQSRAEFRLVMQVGSLQQTAEEGGCAHFLEHVAFGPSTHFPGRSKVEYLESLGMKYGQDINAFTGFDRTIYLFAVPTDRGKEAAMDQSLLILRDWLAGAIIDSAKVENEKGIILEELRGYDLGDDFYDLKIGNGIYRQRLPLGTADEIKAMTARTLKNFYHRWYRPEHAAIIVVGDIHPQTLEQKIIQTFSSLQNADTSSRQDYPLVYEKGIHSFTVMDSLQKRINFTQMLCQKLGISANFYHQRAEDFAKTNREAFDVATARAVAPLPVLLEYTAQIVKVGGSIVAYKTDLEESLTAKNACKVLGLVLADSKNFTLPDGSRRCILQYVKKTHTPTQYPRGQNKPRKSPL